MLITSLIITLALTIWTTTSRAIFISGATESIYLLLIRRIVTEYFGNTVVNSLEINLVGLFRSPDRVGSEPLPRGYKYVIGSVQLNNTFVQYNSAHRQTFSR